MNTENFDPGEDRTFTTGRKQTGSTDGEGERRRTPLIRQTKQQPPKKRRKEKYFHLPM